MALRDPLLAAAPIVLVRMTALFLLALSVPWGWASIIGPLTLSDIILFVSGIPMTERFMEGNPAFAAYKRRTSPFIPWFPGKE